MLLIPALDIINGQVVRLAQGDYSRKTIYSNDPVDIALRFSEAGVKRLHLVDLDGAAIGNPVNFALFAEIKKKTKCIIEAGGGIRSLVDADRYFENGLNADEDFIMIGSLPFHDPDAFSKICEKYIKNILLTVDVWDRNVKISGWKVDTKMHIKEFLNKMTSLGIRNILATQIKRDGMLTGPDIDLYKEIGENFPVLSTIVSGGVSSLNDSIELKPVKGIKGFIVGRAYYENKISLEDIRKYHKL